MKLDIERIGKLVEYVDYNHTYKSWDELKKYLRDNNIYYSCYKRIEEDGENLGWEIMVSVDDCEYEKIEQMWEDFKLVGDPVNLDYVVFYYEDGKDIDENEIADKINDILTFIEQMEDGKDVLGFATFRILRLLAEKNSGYSRDELLSIAEALKNKKQNKGE